VYNQVFCKIPLFGSGFPHNLGTKLRRVKDNEEINVRLLLCVLIGVPLNATLLSCLDTTNKNKQKPIRTTNKKPHKIKQTISKQTSNQKNPQTEYFRQVNKL